MGNQPDSQSRQSVIERHAQTIISGVVAALLGWVGVSLLDLRDRTTRVEVQLVSLLATVTEGTTDRFRGADWLREKARLDDRFYSLQRRVEQLEDSDRAIHQKYRLKDAR